MASEMTKPCTVPTCNTSPNRTLASAVRIAARERFHTLDGGVASVAEKGASFDGSMLAA